MQYDRNNPPKIDDPIEPTQPGAVNDPYGHSYDGPHWGWFIAVFALLLLGLAAIGPGSGDKTLTAQNDRAETSGSAPFRP